jgi:stearoyl-CoA desaturase (Delta-9 desaturase)
MPPTIPVSRINWTSSLFLTLTFLGALIGVPLFIWHHGLDLFYVGLFAAMFFVTGISITLGYHRLFAHRAFKASWPVRLWTLLFGACAFEDSALDWASDHRKHHKHVDEEEDPYDISKGFFWAHMGWIFFKLYPRQMDNVGDLKKDRLVMWQHKWHRQVAVGLGLGLPTLLGFLYAGGVGALGGFLFGGLLRLVAVQHCTFFINSLCHTIGSRPYDSRTSARDSFLMALLTFGEGYHNYHHSFQHDYRNGVKGWHFDPTKWSIWVLSKLGLVSDLKRVPREKIVLAELREIRRKAEEQLAELEASDASNCPRWRAALEGLRELYGRCAENYAELEEAVAQQARVSQTRLAEWRSQSVEFMERLSVLCRQRAEAVAS